MLWANRARSIFNFKELRHTTMMLQLFFFIQCAMNLTGVKDDSIKCVKRTWFYR